MTAAILAFRTAPEAASRLAVVEALDASRAIGCPIEAIRPDLAGILK